MKGSLLGLVLLSLMILATEASTALPRFASRTGTRCQSCHVDPSGASMRQTFGVQYGRSELPVPTWSKESELEDFTNALTNFLSVGADFRTLYFYQQSDTTATGRKSRNNAFFEMQGDLYFNFKVTKKVNVFLNKGLRSGFEVFGLLNVLPASGYVKIGKFTPNFGTRLDDHTAYIRTYTGFSPEQGRPELTGAELAICPGPVAIAGGIYNAEDGFGSGTGSNKAYLGRAEGMFNLSEDVHLSAGTDVYTSKGADGTTKTLYGGLGSFSYQALTLFGEVDWIATKLSGLKTTGLVSYVEADYVVTPGLDLKLAYEFYDPDIDLKTGASSRYTMGFEFFPLSGVEVRPLYRYIKATGTDVKSHQMELHVHFYL